MMGIPILVKHLYIETAPSLAHMQLTGFYTGGVVNVLTIYSNSLGVSMLYDFKDRLAKFVCDTFNAYLIKRAYFQQFSNMIYAVISLIYL